MSENVNAEQGVSAHWQTFGKAGSGGGENDAGCWDGTAIWWCEKNDSGWWEHVGRIAEEEREKLHVRLDKIEQIFYINSGDFIPKSRKYKCTNGAQTLVVWAFSNFVENLRTTISKKSIIIL